jgi:hypothetical protein
MAFSLWVELVGDFAVVVVVEILEPAIKKKAGNLCRDLA